MLFSLSLCVWYVYFEGCVIFFFLFDTSFDDSRLFTCMCGMSTYSMTIGCKNERFLMLIMYIIMPH